MNEIKKNKKEHNYGPGWDSLPLQGGVLDCIPILCNTQVFYVFAA